MTKYIALSLLLFFIQLACSLPQAKVAPVGPEIKKIQDLVQKGSYDDALKLAKDYVAKVPGPVDADQALYLQGYILAYDKTDLENCRPPLRKLIKDFPNSSLLVPAQKLISDTQYWQGHYHGAVEEYKKLEGMGDANLTLYAKLQIGNSLLLDDKVGDALLRYKDLIEKNPGTPIADSAQLMTANAYLKLQNVSQSKKELKKLIAQSQNHDIQESAQKALRQIEEDASFSKAEHKSK